MTNEEKAEFWTWVEKGVQRGWITEPFCYTHDGDPYMTEEDLEEYEEGGDPCMPVFKLMVSTW